MSPIHINYINEGMHGNEASGYSDDGPWKSLPLKISSKKDQIGLKNSFILPGYLNEIDEGNFIIPDPIYNDDAFKFSSDRFQDVIDTPSTSLISVNASNEQNMRKRKKRYKEHRRSRHAIENETLLLQDITQDTSKGARPKIYSFHNYKKPDQIGNFS